MDVKTQNLMGIFANIIEHIPHDQLNELVQASLQDNADKKPFIHLRTNGGRFIMMTMLSCKTVCCMLSVI
ncbi:hypothetical protein AO370_1072 [Moraxella catarrhalis]|uniref:Uncharacterized protein n=1 Tax=Moraxella catarrhalis TaxID=480 RepID=A0AB36DNA3_MORCA|nr:hypothetical protein AO370_1072 [Moraxella catarrhalis]